MISASLTAAVEHALTLHSGASQRLKNSSAVGGGCISNATRLETEQGEVAFLKWGRAGDFPRGLFACEAHSLEVMAETSAVRVPHVIALDDNADNPEQWLLLEWLEPGVTTRSGWEELGRGLARLHGERGAHFGWIEPNFIGSLPQSNEWHDSWPAFWREQRILPQVHAAAGRLGSGNVRRIEQLIAGMDEMLAAGDDDAPSLLHGDLWGGNVHGMVSGSAALIDPSSYYGHREVDLAMAQLFGGFHERFFAAYREAWPLAPGSGERVSLYQLYYLLVHVNLFGGSYVSGSMSLVDKLGF